MSCVPNNRHDDILMDLVMENKTLVNFLFSIFGFLGRRTDFYVVRNNDEEEGIGFPPGMAEELVIKILRNCNPFRYIEGDSDIKISSNDECVPNMVAQEVEVETSDFEDAKFKEQITPSNNNELDMLEKHIAKENTMLLKEEIKSIPCMENLSIDCRQEVNVESKSGIPECKEKYEPEPMRSEEIDKFNTAESQKDSETYNGAKCDKYNWSQKIGELDVTVPLPSNITSARHLQVNITTLSMVIDYNCNEVWHSLIKDNFTHKIKSGETVWIMSEGKLRIHLEKQKERWWTHLLENEPEIDTTKIDCSRPLEELPEEHIAKVRELQWNQMQKLAGKPTSDETQKQEMLRKAWNLDGSPFKNTPFDPSILN